MYMMSLTSTIGIFFCFSQGSYLYPRGTTAVLSTKIEKIVLDIVDESVRPVESMDTA